MALENMKVKVDPTHIRMQPILTIFLYSGLLDIGMGWEIGARLMSVLNVPSIGYRHMKKREREVGQAIEDEAEESCQKFLNIEKEK